MQEQPRVALVTGASRGAGKGIALALGQRGYRVYVTGRSRREGDASLPGTVYATAEAVSAAGGTGIPVICDHADDAQVAALFERIRADGDRLDILVNNVALIHDDLMKGGGFWEKSPAVADIIDTGLRSAFIASYHAAPLMVAAGDGLIVTTSSFGACCYMHHPAYGAQKAGLDKLAWDMAIDLAPHGVCTASLWMGPLDTERLTRAVRQHPELYREFAANAETPVFIGRLIDALSRDPERFEKSGRTLITAELARDYGITDRDGKQPGSYREALGDPLRFSRTVVA